MALLADRDDTERNAYGSKAGIFGIDEPITVTAAPLGRTVAGTARDWSTEFPDELDQRR